MLVHQFLEKSVIQYPDKTAVIHDGSRITYKELNRSVNSLAYFLQKNGVSKGDRVAFLFENNVDYVTAYYASLKIGAVAAPLNPGLKPQGLKYLLHDLKPASIITSFKSEPSLKALNLSESFLKLLVIRSPKQKWSSAPFAVHSLEDTTSDNNATLSCSDLNENELASIIYTSGSTGQPKGVMLSHKNIVSNTDSICQSLSITHRDTQMVVLPFFYVMGKSLLNTHIAAGATVVINNRFMYPADVVNQMISEKVTSFSGVPSTYAYLLNRSPLVSCQKKLDHLRYCSQAGGHMAKTVKVNLRKALPDHTQIVIMYGATEASARLTCLPAVHFESKIESIGKPIPGVSIRLVDENDNEVLNGQEGELVATGPNIMQGYWNDPDATNEVLGKRGYRTGDVGFRDADGFLYVLRRKDGLLKVGGHRINPTEIEDFLMATGLLIETAVVGLPDELLGTKLMALIVTKEDTTEPASVMEKCVAGLPRHKHPAGIIPIRALPKNSNGKIDKNKCVATLMNS